MQEYNAAVDDSTQFNPTVLDGRQAKGLPVPRANWANRLDKPEGALSKLPPDLAGREAISQAAAPAFWGYVHLLLDTVTDAFSSF